MDRVHVIPSDVAFTSSVKAVQVRKGSRQAYARMEEARPWQTTVTPDLAQFIAAQTSVFLATANAEGQPYIQHRGGPPGFLHLLDDKTIAFADFAGNRQYITTGNLAENPKAHLFLIDYGRRRRVKIWGEARVVEGDAGLSARLMPKDYKARVEQVILFTVSAWDANCPQHIPQRFDAADVAAALAERDRRIAALRFDERSANRRGRPEVSLAPRAAATPSSRPFRARSLTLSGLQSVMTTLSPPDAALAPWRKETSRWRQPASPASTMLSRRFPAPGQERRTPFACAGAF